MQVAFCYTHPTYRNRRKRYDRHIQRIAFHRNPDRARMQNFTVAMLAIAVNLAGRLSQLFLNGVTVLFRYCVQVVYYPQIEYKVQNSCWQSYSSVLYSTKAVTSAKDLTVSRDKI
jgi:phage gp36-like protein